MEDVQSSHDHRQIPIDHVGITDILWPISVSDRARETQQTVGRFRISVDLPKEFKGTHMSRFVTILSDFHHNITADALPGMIREVQRRLHAEKAHLEVRFPYFVEKAAPVSGSPSLMEYQCAFHISADGDKIDFILEAAVPVTSLCPCSKAVSDYGAHNQRGIITMKVQPIFDGPDNFRHIWLEELFETAEASASAPIYALLKREDERFVTMQAYDNPVFVEDMVRNTAVRLREDERVGWYEVTAVNDESIHNHKAFAVTTWTRGDE
ncbi:GTP cyclohydrolase I FolE2 [Myxococcota bacterium]|nr:GTP cyclohydrolase I FolE2 [Myxococcota bacterium]MBU1379399.1 GTP cyclohydrolase I FolE2 [Myxococcota bacterium]MBU1496801.1 GTP cyclohydrolase I FolE2 [Myxococcota bacterium]